MWAVLSGVFLGWALGANDAANVFGPAVSSNVIKFRKATILTAIFIVIGALLEGRAGIETVSGLTGQTTLQAFLCMLSAGVVVTIMTVLKLPVSTSQAVIGSVIGAGLVAGGVNWKGFGKVVICWVGTPLGAALIACVIYISTTSILRRFKVNLFEMDSIMRWGLIVCSVYGAYALGANNVANTTVVFVSAGILDPLWALIIGSLSIALGVITYSKNVIRTVGKSVVPLNGFSALITLFSSAVTVHFYAIVGVPVSTSQAIVGSVLGIGLIKGLYVINIRTLIKIFSGWILTPVLSVLISILLAIIFI